jgi:hypothetical protein
MAVTTEPPWLNKSTGTAARNGTTSHTLNFTTDGSNPFTPTDGSFLLLIIHGAVTHTISGWTEQAQPVSSGELSVFTRTASSTTSVTVTHNGSNYPINWCIEEYPAGTTFTGVDSTTGSNDTMPALTGLPGTAQVIIGALGRTAVGSETGASISPSAPWVEDADLFAVRTSGTDGTYLAVVHQINYTGTSITPTISPTYTGTWGGATREKASFALNAAAVSSTTPFTKDIDLRSRVLAAVTKDTAVQSRVLAALTKDTALQSRILAALTVDTQLVSRVLNALTKDTQLTSRVLAAVAKDAELQSRVLAAMTKDTELQSRVLAAFTDDTELHARVLNALTKDAELQSRVLAAFTDDTELQSRVLAGFTDDTELQSRVLNAVTKDTELQSRVWELVTDDVALAWSISNLVEKDVELIWSAAGTAFRDVALAWSIANPVTKDVDLAWSVAGTAFRDVDLAWSVSSTVTKDVALAWSAAGGVYRDVALAWSVEGITPVVADFVVLWSIGDSRPTVAWIFPDVQRLLVEYLAAWVGEDQVDTETPDDLQTSMPFIRVQRVGGGRDRVSDYPTVELQFFAGTYAQVHPLAERISEWLCGPPSPVPQIDRALCTSAPMEIPYGDVRIRRLVATYQLTTRRVRVPLS